MDEHNRHVEDTDRELERVRQLEIEQLLRPVLLVTDGLLVVALLLAAPAYPPGRVVLVAAALLIAIANLWAVAQRMARSADPSHWVLFHEIAIALMVAATVALSGGWGSPAVALAATVAAVISARLRGRELGIALGVLLCGLVVAGELTAPVPTGIEVTAARALAWTAAIVGIAGMTTRLAHAERAARGTAVTDPVTGLLNREAFERRVNELSSQIGLTGEPISVLMCDLDGFKAVNDTHGHARGDAVLREVSHLMRLALRRFELLYRVGGDEFVILLPGAEAREAIHVAERLRSAVAANQPVGTHVTLSVGVGTGAGRHADLRAVLADADAALYEAKAAGRDCVLTAAHPRRLKAPA